MKLRTLFPILAATGAAVLALVLPGGAGAIVAGAGYTTFITDGQCLHGSVTNCNAYASKGGVYMSGGPVNAALTTGSYFFEVIAPGSQGDAANPSSSELLSSDDVTHRTFTVGSDGQVDTADYTGGHAIGTNANGKHVIGLAPFADTPNPGHVYILAICATGATSAAQCKFDAFKAPDGDTECDDCGPVDPFGVTNGLKYYDANTNGQFDPGETPIANWPIDYHDIVSGRVLTDVDGTFSLTLLADDYTFTERAGGGTWMQTGNTVDQSSVDGGATVTLNADKTYTVHSPEFSTANGLNFGNVCIGGGGGGLTLGFWSNKNGQALESGADLTFLSGLNLRDAKGNNYDPPTQKSLSSWLLSASATNMAYMLSAQLTAMELNVRHGFVNGSALIYAPGTGSANTAGFASVNALMAEGNTLLGTNAVTVASGPARTAQEAVKTALDKANNNLNFVQAGPANCPAPPAP